MFIVSNSLYNLAKLRFNLRLAHFLNYLYHFQATILPNAFFQANIYEIALYIVVL